MMAGTAEERQAAELAARADALMQAGRLDEAAQLWENVLALNPGHPRALLHLGQHILYRKEPLRARAMLERAAQADPANPVVTLNLSFAFRALGDANAEMAALIRALTIDPYFLPAMLARAALHDRLGEPRKAAKIYKDVLTVVPAGTRVEPWLEQQLARARSAVEDDRMALAAHLEQRLGPIKARHGGADTARFDESRDVMIGARKIFPQQPTLLHCARLPAIPFYDTSEFSWRDEVEQAAPAIREELLEVLNTQDSELAPYVRHPDGVPLNQWAALNRSRDWSVYFLFKDGHALAEHCARCPRTAALLARLPLANVPGIAPTAFFSILQSRTLIPPHTGVTNARLVVHLPLIVPEGCWFRVGNEKREWQEGKAVVFDDSIEHEAWNGSDRPRALLIFDIWNPYLTAVERELVSELLVGFEDYYGQPANGGGQGS